MEVSAEDECDSVRTVFRWVLEDKAHPLRDQSERGGLLEEV